MSSGQTPTTSIVFFGTEDFSLYSLRALVEHGFAIAAVITKPDTKRGRHAHLTAPAVKVYAEAHSIPVWQPTRITDCIPLIQALDRPAGVLVSYGRIIPERIIELFAPGIINVHPSLLPQYRGPSPIESAILHRDSQTGITLMQLSKAMDAGPIYHQVVHPLAGTETRPELYETLGKKGAQQLATQLPAILDGSLAATSQDDSLASYCELLSRQHSRIDPAAMTAADADAHVRAYLGYPGSRLRLGNREVIVTSTHVSDVPTELSVRCADGQHLAIDTLKPVGKKEMPARAFLMGYSSQL